MKKGERIRFRGKWVETREYQKRQGPEEEMWKDSQNQKRKKIDKAE